MIDVWVRITSLDCSCVAQHQRFGSTAFMIRCRLHEMQNLLVLISNLFQQFGRLLSGGDRWFLVLDEGLVIQENSARQYKQSQYAVPVRLRRENFNRQYEAQRQFSSKSLTIVEIWSVLNPFSIVNFLRYSLSDVI